jgi:hypothetical protein
VRGCDSYRRPARVDVLGSWDRAGRWLAGGTLVVAAVYELTPLKDVCLAKCRSPLGFLLGAWRDGLSGALQMGVRHGGWCIGCCWALMASLFALGVMSLAWVAFVAALIAAEKTLPWGRAVTYGTAVLLLLLGVVLMVAPDAIPGPDGPGRRRLHGRHGQHGRHAHALSLWIRTSAWWRVRSYSASPRENKTESARATRRTASCEMSATSATSRRAAPD